MKRAGFIHLFLCTTPTITLCVCHTIAWLHTTMSHPHVFSLLRSCITSCPTHYYMSCNRAPPLFPTHPPNQCSMPYISSSPSMQWVFPTLLFPSHITQPSLLPSHPVLCKTIAKQQVLELLHPHRAEHWCGRHGVLLHYGAICTTPMPQGGELL